MVERADKPEVRLDAPNNSDDPRWLMRRIDQLLRFASRRELARQRKAQERGKSQQNRLSRNSAGDEQS